MREPTTPKRKFNLFILLIYFLIFSLAGSHEIKAQGWTFTPQVKLTGNCEGAGAAVAQANAMLAGFGNLMLPTKAQCESLRQQILAIQVGGGECLVGYTCSPCTGSNTGGPGVDYAPGMTGSSGLISTPGQINPDGYFQGKALFSRHESTAFEDWAIGYKQLLASFGITSILGRGIIPNQFINTPLTGNLAVDTTYARMTAQFNPSTPPTNPYSQDASVVDLSHLGDKPGVVGLLTDAEEQRKRDEWLKEKEFTVTKDLNITDVTTAPSYMTDEMLNDLSKIGINLVKFGLVGLAVPVATTGATGVAVTLAATAVICVGFKEFEAISDYVFEDKPLPSAKEFLVNSLGDVAVDVLTTGIGKAVGAVAQNSSFVQNLITQENVAKGVLPGIAKLRTAEMRVSGEIAGKIETAFGFGYEAGAEGQSVSKLINKYQGK